MNTKIFIGAILIGLIFFAENVSAYDLPKIKVDKFSSSKIENKTSEILKSDWESMALFEQKIKTLLEKKSLAASAKERIYHDKNNIFIAIYKDNLYFLDKYSIEVKKDLSANRTWRQRIFAIGKNVSPKNSSAIKQTFFTDGENFYNSSRHNNDLKNISNESDRKFLIECFKVGYYYAFGEEIVVGDDWND